MEKKESQLKDLIEAMDFDLLVVEIQKDKNGLRSVAVTKEDLQTLDKMHSKSATDVVNEIMHLVFDPSFTPTPSTESPKEVKPIDK